MKMSTLFLLVLASTVLPCWTHHHQPCKETKHGPDSGLVRIPDFGDPPVFNVSCVWDFPLQNNRKLLIKVDSVNFPSEIFRQSSLKLVLDDETIDILRNCTRCLKQTFVSSNSVKVIYMSALLHNFALADSPSEVPTSDIGAFQIRYKSFDPARCDSPKQPVNGFASVPCRKIGRKVVYGCKPPYDVVGSDKAVCGVKDILASPVPEWSAGPPRCVISNCSSTVYRTVGMGAVASPGYPLYVIPFSVDCRWVLQAQPKSQIRMSITYLQLSEGNIGFGNLILYNARGDLLSSFNETSENPLTLTINSSEIILTFRTNNSQPIKAGFYLDYELLNRTCSVPSNLEFGNIIFTNATVNSTATYRCIPGYMLLGENQSFCSWSGGLRSCVPQLEFSIHDHLDMSSSGSPRFLPAPTHSPEKSDSVHNSISKQLEVAIPSRELQVNQREVPEITSSTPETLIHANVKTTTATEIISNKDEVSALSWKPTHKEKSFQIANYTRDQNTKFVQILRTQSEDDTTGVEPPDSVERVVNGTPRPFPIPDLNSEEKETEIFQILENEEKEREFQILGPRNYIVIGVASFALLVVVTLVLAAALSIYRKRFPSRLRFRRKFSTFENPIYVNKESLSSTEIKRLTI